MPSSTRSSSTRRNFYIPDDLYTALERAAKKQRKSASDVLRVALVEHLDLPKSYLPPSRYFAQQVEKRA